MFDTDLKEYTVMVTIGDEYGVANKMRFCNSYAAEEWANAMLGRGWNTGRTISLATFYKLGENNEWVYDLELEW